MDISATQVIASVLAAVTGAVAASFLGVAGTVIGAALMSVASTAVAGIYKHGLARSRERLQAAAEAGVITPLVGGGAVAAFRGRQRPAGRHQTGDGQHDDQRTVTSPQVPGDIRATGPGGDPTAMFLVAGAQPPAEFQTRPWNETDQFAAQPRDPAPAGGGPAGPADRVKAAHGPADGAARADRAPGTGGGAHARRDSGAGRRPRPLVLAGLALSVFVLVMAGVTVFEVVAGKPLDAVVTGKSGSGTTISSIVGGNSHPASNHTKPGSPGVTPATTPTPGASTAPSPTPSPSAAPANPSPSAGGNSPDNVPSSSVGSGTAPDGTSAPDGSP
jgi:hypothetical protein